MAFRGDIGQGEEVNPNFRHVPGPGWGPSGPPPLPFGFGGGTGRMPWAPQGPPGMAFYGPPQCHPPWGPYGGGPPIPVSVAAAAAFTVAIDLR